MTPEERAQLDCFVTNSGIPPQPIADALTLQAARETIPRLLDVAEAGGRGRIVTQPWSQLTHPLHAELGALFDKYGSDKATPHKYHHLYAWILGPRADEALRVFEVGLGSNNPNVTGSFVGCAHPGASLRAFRDFLPKSLIFGADVDRGCLFAEDRISTIFVDATDPSSFVPIGHSLRKLDLVIDDGLHSPHANIATLAHAVRWLNPGGWVVIEDIRATSLGVWQLAAALLPADTWTSMIIQADTGGRIFVAQRLP